MDTFALILREDKAGAAGDGPHGPHSWVGYKTLKDLQVGFGEILGEQELLCASRALGGEGAGHAKLLVLEHHCPHVRVGEFDKDGCREDSSLGVFGGLAGKVGRD